jgi:hypothetical protein
MRDHRTRSSFWMAVLLGFILGFWLVVLIGCTTEPTSDEPYAALPQYAGWYAEVEACSGHRGDFARLRFFVLDSLDARAGHQQGDDVWIRWPYWSSRKVVEHEILHTLIGDADHSRAEWIACGLYPLTVDQALAP